MVEPGPVSEYTAVRKGGAGLIDFSSRGRINISGTEAVPFLNGLITNDVKTLELNSWVTAAFPNVQGRLLAAVRVLHTSAGYLLDTEATTSGKVLELVKRFTLAGDFQVADLTASTASISIQGTGSSRIIKALLGEGAADVERQRIVQTQLPDGAAVNVMRASHTGEDGFDLFTNAENAPSLWEALIAAGAQPVGLPTLEVLRIEAGLPRYGVDMDETSIVLETMLDDAVSFTKGCYIGQEIIARITHRGHVAKKLTGLRFAGEVRIEEGAKIRSVDGKEIGRVTSATYSPHLGRTIALGYVKYDFLAPGTVVQIISSAEEIAAEVAELPFVRGSWYSN
ncbi:MAG: aminomethyltransferase family protein [Pyrinomonadaceae bacterium]